MPLTSDSKFKLKTCLIGSRTFEHLDACTYVEHNHPLYNPLDVAHTLGRVRDKVLHPNHTSNAYFSSLWAKPKISCQAYKRNLEKNEPKSSHFEEKIPKLPYLDNKFLEGAK
jgi:hypothetical protein